MKILSSYKDYYDYLTGIYGIDPIIVLDRTKHKQPYDIGIDCEPYSSSKEHVINHNKLWIGYYCVEFMTYDGIPYFGEDIKNIPGVTIEDERSINFHWWSISYEKKYGMPINELKKIGLFEVSWEVLRHNNSTTILKQPIKMPRPLMLRDDVIIGLGSFSRKDGYGDYEYPILSKLGLNKYVPAETVYQWIVEYISDQKLKAEQHIDTRTNNQKIEGKGFDKITSFRPNIKN
jgi:hypothetical protein